MSAPESADPRCMCGCPKSKHRGKGLCRQCGEFECDRFEAVVDEHPVQLDEALAELEATDPAVAEAAARLDETTAAIAAKARTADEFGAQPFPEGWLPAERREAAEALRRVEQERDDAREQLKQMSAFRAEAIAACTRLRDERNLASSELASARQELELLRRASDAELQRLIPRAEQAEHDLSRAKQDLAAAEERIRVLQHGEAVDDQLARAAAANVIDRSRRYLCEACGARYGQPYADYEHGPLTPVTVLIIREQGAPPA